MSIDKLEADTESESEVEYKSRAFRLVGVGDITCSVVRLVQSGGPHH